MPHLFVVLFKINLVLLLFAAAYYLILRKLTFYVMNRMFLLFGILFSTCYPFINLTALLNGQKGIPEFVPELNHHVSNLVHLSPVSLMWQLIELVFYTGVLVMAVRLAIQFLSLYSVHRKSKPGFLDNHRVRVFKDQVSPFSFWQTIYINPELHAADELQHILAHEKVHVREWHTIDIILSEISLVLYWFNPGVWLMKKAVRENIEFITDAKILKNGLDKRSYQYSLLGVGTLRQPVTIVNNFNLSDLRKRIIMMNSKRSSKMNLTRYLFALAVLIGLTLAFTIDKKDAKQTLQPITVMVKQDLPEVAKKTVVRLQASSKNEVRKSSLHSPAQHTDSTKKISLVFNTSFDTADTSQQAIAGEMQKLVGRAIKVKMNTESKVNMYQFTFKDTLRLDPTLMTMVPNDQKDSVSPDKLKRPVTKMIFIKTINKIPGHAAGNIAISGSNGEMDFFVNGRKVEKEDIKAFDVNQIADITLRKNSTSSVYINTKP